MKHTPLRDRLFLADGTAVQSKALPYATGAIAAMLIVVAFGLWTRPLLADILPRWTRLNDLKSFAIYVLIAAVLYAGLILARKPRGVLVVIALLWTAVLVGVGPLVTTAMLAAVAYLLGSPLLSRTDLDARASAPLALALGYSVIMAVVQALVLAGFATPGVILGLVAVVIFVGRRHIAGSIPHIRSWFERPMGSGAFGWSAMPLFLVGAVQLVYASFAETHSDALVVHLLIPHQVALTGTWPFDVDTYNFATMPKGASWLFSAHYILSGELAVRLFNFVLTAATAWLVVDEVRRRADVGAGLFLAAVFISSPLTFWCVLVLFEDALLAFLVTAAVVLLTSAWRRPSPVAAGLIALLAAACIATKAQGLIAIAPIGVGLLARLVWTNPPKKIAVAIGMMALPFVALGGVPYFVSLYLTGNPIFPYYNAIFKSPFFPPENFTDGRWVGKLSPTFLFGLTFNTDQFMEGIRGGFGFQFLLLAPAVFISVAMLRRSTFAVPALVGAAIFIGTCLPTQYARYLYPTFPLLSIAAGALWMRATQERTKTALAGLLVLTVALNVYSFRSINFLHYFFPPSPLSAQAPRQPAYPSERVLNEIVNATHGQKARVLYLSRPWGAGLDGTALYMRPHLNSRLYSEIHSVADGPAFGQALAKFGVTHVMTDDKVTPESDPVPMKNLSSFAQIIARDGSVALWQVVPDKIPRAGGKAL